MTVTARTANLVIETKRIQYDSLLRTKFANDPGAKAAGRVDFLANIGIGVYSEALRWASEKSFRTSTTSAAMYVPDAEWAQVLAAMDKLYTSVRDANTPERLAYIQVGAITGLMPAGYRGQYQNNELPAPTNTVAPAQTPVITTGGNTGTMDPATGALQTGGNNLDQSMTDSSTPVTLQEESGVITLPTTPSDALDNLSPPASITTTGLDPKLKMAGFAAAGLLGAFILVKIAK